MTYSKILLALLPWWTPLVPPQGISRIKGYLQKHGFLVKTVDVNLEYEFKRLYDKYFDILRSYIPEFQRGNFYNIGNDVWRDHMLAHINYEDESKYVELVKIIIYKVFYWPLDNQQVKTLNQVLTEFYAALENYFIDLMNREKPDVVGLSVFRDTLPASLFVFRLVKQINPDIMTVMGGGIFNIHLTPNSPNLGFFMEKTKGFIDKIVAGEGEIVFHKLLQGKLPGSKQLYTKQDIGGETLGFLPVEGYDFSDFDPRHYNYMAAQGSASCPNKCSFCNVATYYGDYRRKDPERTVDEMLYFYKKYGHQIFHMLDSLVNDVVTDIADEIIKRELPFYWDGYFRVPDSCPREMTLLWRRGGFYRARIGVETGSQRILDMMGKKITVEQTRETISNLASAGIKTTAYIVIGHPGETEEDFQQTLDFVEDLKNDIWEAECNPFTYFYSGQGGSDAWADTRVLLYPEWAKDMLITQTWIVGQDHSREEMFSRISRFVQHCKRLGISLPWSMKGVNQSDKRWKMLHRNAVPALKDLFKKAGLIEKNKFVKEYTLAQDTLEDEGEFNF